MKICWSSFSITVSNLTDDVANRFADEYLYFTWVEISYKIDDFQQKKSLMFFIIGFILMIQQQWINDIFQSISFYMLWKVKESINALSPYQQNLYDSKALRCLAFDS